MSLYVALTVPELRDPLACTCIWKLSATEILKASLNLSKVTMFLAGQSLGSLLRCPCSFLDTFTGLGTQAGALGKAYPHRGCGLATALMFRHHPARSSRQ